MQISSALNKRNSIKHQRNDQKHQNHQSLIICCLRTSILLFVERFVGLFYTYLVKTNVFNNIHFILSETQVTYNQICESI